MRVGLIIPTPLVCDQSLGGLKRPNGQSLIRGHRHIIKFDSGLLVTHLDLPGWSTQLKFETAQTAKIAEQLGLNRL